MTSFENTENAFAYKSDAELKKAQMLFRLMGSQFIVKTGARLLPGMMKFRIPGTEWLVKKTIFSQFVGGETLEATKPVAALLARYDVQVILDYGVEGGHNGEAGFDASTQEFIRVIEYAAQQPSVPFMSIKLTGIVRFGLLEKMDEAMKNSSETTLMKKYLSVIENLEPSEKEEWKRVVERLRKICDKANEMHVGVLVDAEETWIQDPVDAITMMMMDVYNRHKAVVYNTIQLYRHDRLEFLKLSFQAAQERNFILGVKLVRGAYMEKERLRAADMGYPSPIQKDKPSCDADYDAGVAFCLERLKHISVMVASHNEQSNLLATQIMDSLNIPHQHPHVHFSQLFGMSDHITFNLAKKGFNVSKYLPFGPTREVIPYLMRRAEENSSVSGQTGRELLLIKKELKRRGI
ncbi:MAG TPA: proline dehydrogenase family protein [Ferruginibacter sp.]|nr:proline dehydrogenase family protein [Ferruginibacter sp.]